MAIIPETAFQANEVIVLIIALFGFVGVSMFSKTRRRMFFTAYTFLFIGILFSVLESVFMPVTLNFLEHLVGLLGVGLVFFMYARANNRRISYIEDSVSKARVNK